MGVTTALLTRPYVANMVTRIGPKHPHRLYLAEWRKKRELTQETLANRIGSTKSSISRWENGGRDITLAALTSIAEALGVTVPDLYHDPDQPSADALLRDASPTVRRQAFRIIEALKTGT